MSFNHNSKKYQRENEPQLYTWVQHWQFKKQHVKWSVIINVNILRNRYIHTSDQQDHSCCETQYICMFIFKNAAHIFILLLANLMWGCKYDDLGLYFNYSCPYVFKHWVNCHLINMLDAYFGEGINVYITVYENWGKEANIFCKVMLKWVLYCMMGNITL